MEQYFAEFEEELNQLYSNNVVLAGSNILRLHGLELGWEPMDLDVIIFNPSDEQIELVEDKLEFSANASYIIQEAVEGRGEMIRSWGKERYGLKLNIIYDDRVVPQGLMGIFINGKYWLCNSIKNIMDAKLSYSVGDSKNFLRRKDVDHFIKLKNNNFNIDISALPDAGKKTVPAEVIYIMEEDTSDLPF